MQDDQDETPSRTLAAPRVPTFEERGDSDPPPTEPEASPRPAVVGSSVPPENPSDLREAMRAVVQAGRRIDRYQRELFEPHGVITRLSTNLEILVQEVRGIRTDFNERLTLFEARLNTVERELKAEVGELRQTVTEQNIRIELLEKRAEG